MKISDYHNAADAIVREVRECGVTTVFAREGEPNGQIRLVACDILVRTDRAISLLHETVDGEEKRAIKVK